MQNFGGVVRLLPNQVVLITACGLEVLKTFLVRQSVVDATDGTRATFSGWFKLSDPSSGGNFLMNADVAPSRGLESNGLV